MNYTKSGIMAVGAPGSVVRIERELENALEKGLHLLLLTDEGLGVVARFAAIEGCDYGKTDDAGLGELLARKGAWKFFMGVLWGLRKASC